MIRVLLVVCLAALCANADAFKAASDCVVGKSVTDNANKSGEIIKIDRSSSMCQVALNDGTQSWYLFWMLRSTGASAETDDKLMAGKYACYVGGNYTFTDIRITGANTYSTEGGSGRFHVEASRQIVFESGPLVRHRAKLTRGPNIDINSDGGSFYGTSCSYQKK